MLTPSWTWHDHGNESDEPMIWLDGLDLPLVNYLEATFFENYPEVRQPLPLPVDGSQRKYARRAAADLRAAPQSFVAAAELHLGAGAGRRSSLWPPTTPAARTTASGWST